MKYLIFISIIVVACNSVRDKSDLKVMTFNIRCGQCDENTPNSWEKRKTLVAELIENYKPDLIGYQEMILEQRDYIKSNFTDLSFYGTGREKDGSGEGCYIFYNKNKFEIDSANSGTFWISSTPDIPGSSDLGDIYKRICTYIHIKYKISGKYFFVCNVHSTYIDSLQEKYIEVIAKELSKRIKYPNPIIITGDFNTDENRPAILKLKSFGEKFEDSYRVIHPNGSVGTFHAFTGKDDGKKIDYIFVQKNRFKVNSAEIIRYNKNGLFPSDHYILISELSIKKNKMERGCKK